MVLRKLVLKPRGGEQLDPLEEILVVLTSASNILSKTNKLTNNKILYLLSFWLFNPISIFTTVQGYEISLKAMLIMFIICLSLPFPLLEHHFLILSGLEFSLNHLIQKSHFDGRTLLEVHYVIN